MFEEYNRAMKEVRVFVEAARKPETATNEAQRLQTVMEQAVADLLSEAPRRAALLSGGRGLQTPKPPHPVTRARALLNPSPSQSCLYFLQKFLCC